MDPKETAAARAREAMRASGYPVVEVEEGGKVHAETEVLLGERSYAFPVVLTIGEDVWTYEVERAGYFGDMFEVAPGGIVTPEFARGIVKGWWRAAGLDDEYEIWCELIAMRHPGEEPPTEEEIRAALEDYRRRLDAEAVEAAKREREGERFIVKPGNRGERVVRGGALCEECGDFTSAGTINRDGEVPFLRPVHVNCFEKLQWNSGFDLSHETMVEIRGFIVAEYVAEEDDE